MWLVPLYIFSLEMGAGGPVAAPTLDTSRSNLKLLTTEYRGTDDATQRFARNVRENFQRLEYLGAGDVATTLHVSGYPDMSGDIEIAGGIGINVVQITATKFIMISLADEQQTLNVVTGASIVGGNLVLTTKDITFYGTISDGADITIEGDEDCTPP